MDELKIFLAIIWIIVLLIFGIASVVDPVKSLRFRGIFRKVNKEDDPRFGPTDFLFMRVFGLFAILMSLGIIYMLVTGKIR